MTDNDERDVDDSNILEEKSDMVHAMKELFKEEKNAIDLRTRLISVAVKSHSIISFLNSYKVNEVRESKARKKPSLFLDALLLSVEMKRHLVSLDGKSRSEIVELFKSDLTNRLTSGGGMNFNLMGGDKK